MPEGPVPEQGVPPGLRLLLRELGLSLPADWQEHPVLRPTSRELGRMGGLQQLEG